MSVGEMTETTKQYETPRVTEYGKFEEITKQQGKGSTPEDGASRQPPGQA